MRRHALVAVLVLSGCSGAVDGNGNVDEALSRRRVPICGVTMEDARCHAQVIVDATTGEPAITAAPSGYAPADLRSAYAVPASTSTHTVAIVDAYNNPNVESDLGVYRAQFGLSPCTTANGCFRKVDENGGTNYPRGNTSWGQEISLDVQMVSAICPSCKILLVEAASASFTDLGTGVNTAVKLGATVVSNSYGGAESSTAPAQEKQYFDHPGVSITVSSGDGGFGVEFPASSQFVTAVGGTSLKRATTARGWSEIAWSGAGSGCSAYITKPTWQKDAGCAMRTVADVSAIADPNTGVAVYDSYGHGPSNKGWLVFGGTSVASPIVAGMYGIAGTGADASVAYAHVSSLFDVVGGSNGSCATPYLCTAVAGYDGPTGLGTPDGTAAF
ncbi:MAG TPA: S53 family peptidase [Polyangia bacterium]|nr:S53 family peptidase [Polyangia bacterium]